MLSAREGSPLPYYIVRPIKLLCSCYRVEEKRHCTVVDGALAESTFVVMTHDVPMTCP